MCTKTKARNFTGCWACRFKKRRCDERKPYCSLCLKHGDQCSYDIRLMWLDDNMFSTNEKRELICMKEIQGSKNSRSRCRSGKHRISKKRFREMTQFRQLSPPNSDDEMASCDSDDDSGNFTISIRRLKIYNNALNCIHGEKSQNFDQKFVDRQLSRHLCEIDTRCESHMGSDHGCCVRSGPFSIFKIAPPSAAVTPRNSVTEIIESSSLPDTPTSLLRSSQGQLDEHAFLDSSTNITEEFLGSFWPRMLVENDDNFCLKQPAYVSWLASKVHVSINLIAPQFLSELMHTSVDFDKWLKFLPVCPQEGQALYLLLMALNKCTQEVIQATLDWIKEQKTITYLAYPLLALSLSNSADIALLFHCHDLLTNSELEDLFQYELISTLKINAIQLILQQWNNLMLDQICQCQDTTYTEMQLKFWEMQLQSNEDFYRDICLT